MQIWSYSLIITLQYIVLNVGTFFSFQYSKTRRLKQSIIKIFMWKKRVFCKNIKYLKNVNENFEFLEITNPEQIRGLNGGKRIWSWASSLEGC